MRPSPSLPAHRRTPQRARAAGALLLAAGLLAGCSSGDGEATGATTTVSSAPVATQAPTTTTTAAPSTPVTTAPKPGMTPDEIAVRNVLDQYHHEHTIASATGNADRPGLTDTVTGEFEMSMLKTFEEGRAKGITARRSDGSTIRHRTESVEFTNTTTAVAVECVIDDLVTYDRNGVAIDTAVVTSFKNTTVTRESDGKWRVSARQTQPGGGRCPGLE